MAFGHFSLQYIPGLLEVGMNGPAGAFQPLTALFHRGVTVSSEGECLLRGCELMILAGPALIDRAPNLGQPRAEGWLSVRCDHAALVMSSICLQFSSLSGSHLCLLLPVPLS